MKNKPVGWRIFGIAGRITFMGGGHRLQDSRFAKWILVFLCGVVGGGRVMSQVDVSRFGGNEVPTIDANRGCDFTSGVVLDPLNSAHAFFFRNKIGLFETFDFIYNFSAVEQPVHWKMIDQLPASVTGSVTFDTVNPRKVWFVAGTRTDRSTGTEAGSSTGTGTGNAKGTVYVRENTCFAGEAICALPDWKQIQGTDSVLTCQSNTNPGVGMGGPVGVSEVPEFRVIGTEGQTNHLEPLVFNVNTGAYVTAQKSPNCSRQNFASRLAVDRVDFDFMTDRGLCARGINSPLDYNNVETISSCQGAITNVTYDPCVDDTGCSDSTPFDCHYCFVKCSDRISADPNFNRIAPVGNPGHNPDGTPCETFKPYGWKTPWASQNLDSSIAMFGRSDNSGILADVYGTDGLGHTPTYTCFSAKGVFAQHGFMYDANQICTGGHCNQRGAIDWRIRDFYEIDPPSNCRNVQCQDGNCFDTSCPTIAGTAPPQQLCYDTNCHPDCPAQDIREGGCLGLIDRQDEFRPVNNQQSLCQGQYRPLTAFEYKAVPGNPNWRYAILSAFQSHAPAVDNDNAFGVKFDVVKLSGLLTHVPDPPESDPKKQKFLWKRLRLDNGVAMNNGVVMDGTSHEGRDTQLWLDQSGTDSTGTGNLDRLYVYASFNPPLDPYCTSTSTVDPKSPTLARLDLVDPGTLTYHATPIWCMTDPYGDNNGNHNHAVISFYQSGTLTRFVIVKNFSVFQSPVCISQDGAQPTRIYMYESQSGGPFIDVGSGAAGVQGSDITFPMISEVSGTRFRPLGIEGLQDGTGRIIVKNLNQPFGYDPATQQIFSSRDTSGDFFGFMRGSLATESNGFRIFGDGKGLQIKTPQQSTPDNPPGISTPNFFNGAVAPTGDYGPGNYATGGGPATLDGFGRPVFTPEGGISTFGVNDIAIDPSTPPGPAPDPVNGVRVWLATDAGVWSNDRYFTNPPVMPPFSPSIVIKSNWLNRFSGVTGGTGVPHDAQMSDMTYRIRIENYGAIYAATKSGLYRSDDAGTNWKQLTTDRAFDVIRGSRGLLAVVERAGFPGEFTPAMVDDSVIPANITYGAFIDQPGILAFSVPGRISVNPAMPNSMTWGGGPYLFRSVDGGATWNRLHHHEIAPVIQYNAASYAGPTQSMQQEQLFVADSRSGYLHEYSDLFTDINVTPFTCTGSIQQDNNCLNGIMTLIPGVLPAQDTSGNGSVLVNASTTPNIQDGFPGRPWLAGIRSIPNLTQLAPVAWKDLPINEQFFYATRMNQAMRDSSSGPSDVVLSAYGPIHSIPSLPFRFQPYFNTNSNASYKLVNAGSMRYEIQATALGKNFLIPQPAFYLDDARLPENYPWVQRGNESTTFSIQSPVLPHSLVVENALGITNTAANPPLSIPLLVTVDVGAGTQGDTVKIRFNSVADVDFTNLMMRVKMQGQVINATTDNATQFEFPAPAPAGTGFTGYSDIEILFPDGGTLNLPNAFVYLSSAIDAYFSTDFGATTGGTTVRITGFVDLQGFGGIKPVGQMDSDVNFPPLMSFCTCTGPVCDSEVESWKIVDRFTVEVVTGRFAPNCYKFKLRFTLNNGSHAFVATNRSFRLMDYALSSGDDGNGPQLRLAKSDQDLALDIGGGQFNTSSVDSRQLITEPFRDQSVARWDPFASPASALHNGRWTFATTNKGDSYIYNLANREFLADAAGTPRKLGSDVATTPPSSHRLARVIPTDRPYALAMAAFLCRSNCLGIARYDAAIYNADPDSLHFGDTLAAFGDDRALDLGVITRIKNNSDGIPQTFAFGFAALETLQGVQPQVGFSPLNAASPPPSGPTFSAAAPGPISFAPTHLWLVVRDLTRELKCVNGPGCTNGWKANASFLANLKVLDLGPYAPLETQTTPSIPNKGFGPVSFIETDAGTGVGKIFAVNAIAGTLYTASFNPTTPGTTDWARDGLGNPINSATCPTCVNLRSMTAIGTNLYTIYEESNGGFSHLRQYNGAAMPTSPNTERNINCAGSFLTSEYVVNPVRPFDARLGFSCQDSSLTHTWSDFDYSNPPRPFFTQTYPSTFVPGALAMTPQFSIYGSLQLFNGNLFAAPPSDFDQPAHQSALLNYYNQQIAPALANPNLTSGAKQSLLSQLRNLRRDILRWVTDPVLREELVSLLDGAIAAVAQ